MTDIAEQKNHSYYTYTKKKFDIDKLTIFLDEKKHAIVDPVNRLAIDLQVNHPTAKIQAQPSIMAA